MSPQPPAGTLPRADFAAAIRAAREAGRTVVFTNGCFDLLHVGHLRYLRAARALGDLLAVAVNSDASVGRLKGHGRPVVPEAERQEMLAGLSCVDLVTLFDEDTPLALIEESLPTVLVKGADWADKGVVGSDVVAAHGGRVELIQYVEGRSSSELMRRAAEVLASEAASRGAEGA